MLLLITYVLITLVLSFLYSDAIALSKAFDQLLQQRAIILLVVDEYGGVQGILTLEDVLETILELEIIDEGDKSKDMQELARRYWRRRVKAKDLKIDEEISRE